MQYAVTRNRVHNARWPAQTTAAELIGRCAGNRWLAAASADAALATTRRTAAGTLSRSRRSSGGRSRSRAASGVRRSARTASARGRRAGTTGSAAADFDGRAFTRLAEHAVISLRRASAPALRFSDRRRR